MHTPSSWLAQKIDALVGEGGLLSRTLRGFEPRAAQQQMLFRVAEAFEKNEIALIEAGTGTGKSMAYLIPAMLWAAQFGEKTVISTKTIALQEQLLHKDIPLLLQALNLPLKAVLVKGMNNYLCLRKLEDALLEVHLFSEEKGEIEKIEGWKRTAVEGSKSEAPFPISATTWEQVGAEAEACLHHECPHFQNCYFFKARKEAAEAQLLVVNHHLLFTDLKKRAEQKNYDTAAVLPAYKRLILDEAHHIEEIATEHFASYLSRFEFLRILSKLGSDKSLQPKGKLLLLKEKLQMFFLKNPYPEIHSLIQELFIDFPAMRNGLVESLNRTFEALLNFMQKEKSKMLPLKIEISSQLFEQKLRLKEEMRTSTAWIHEVEPFFTDLIEKAKEYEQMLIGIELKLKPIKEDKLHEQTKSVRLDIQALTFKLSEKIALLLSFTTKEKDPSKVRWIESKELKAQHHIGIGLADLEVAKALANSLFNPFPTTVLCSATLTTHRRFDYIKRRLGLSTFLQKEKVVTESSFDSPFDFKNQALLAIATDLPPPTDPSFPKRAYASIWNAIEASRGQAFVLFTSYSMMQECAQALAKQLETHHYPLFKQGDEERKSLLAKFKNTKRAVLFGTDSFWEGVDVAGDALRCVVIVKLPFKVPSEPIMEAKAEAILLEGGNPFFSFSLPQAIVKFKQGFGRLIRQKKDRGCIICLDSRLLTKRYGQLFLESLPECQKLYLPSQQLWKEVANFYRNTHYLTRM